MSRKRIQKRVDQLFSEIEQANDETDAPLSVSQIAEQHYAQLSDNSGEEEKTIITDTHPPASEGKQAKNIFQRFLSRFIRSRSQAEEEQEVGLDYQQVGQRLIGEKPPEPTSEQAIPWSKRIFAQRQNTRPEQQVQTGSRTSPSTVEIRETQEPNFEELRPSALEEYEPTKGVTGRLSILERLREWFNQLHVEQKVLLFSSIFVFGAISFFLILVLFRPTQPVVIPPVSNLDPSIPTPEAVILPDNQAFKLSLGAIVDGKWLPQGSEWLIDTELPRWLSLPWNEELESAVLLYERNDPLQLQMSNGDILVYRFQTVEEILLSEISLFHANTADLLIMLYKPSISTCLVLVAGP